MNELDFQFAHQEGEDIQIKSYDAVKIEARAII